ncbi:MAG: endonuclease MutS2 [Gemmatimonadota bacterium]
MAPGLTDSPDVASEAGGRLEGVRGARAAEDGSLHAGVAAGSRATEHALRCLEFTRVLELIARNATSELGARHVLTLRPLAAGEAVREALRTADEMVGFLLRDEGWSPPSIPDLAPALRRLRAEGSILEPGELVGASTLLSSARRARGDLRRHPDRQPRLSELAGGLLEAPAEQERIARSFDATGSVADGASRELKRIRRALRDSRAALVERLERFARSLPARLQVPDASVTVRAGRYCIPVRREGLSEVGGIVHDESATHRTVFIEPPPAIEPMNRIRELELGEAREVNRILRDLTGLLRPRASELLASLEILVRVDALYACARYALAHGGTGPEVVVASPGELPPELRLIGAAHPLLLASGEPTVPFDLALGAEESVLLVSGPNAGGKTVMLKALGLVCAMAQTGIIPPLRPGSQIPLFRRFFAVIGDEQSIDASLSTFTAQLENLRTILEEADGESLVLVDEIGGNTDPAEGAALSAAVLRRLAAQARLTLATTHLGDLKGLAAEDPRIVNASMQFDTTALRPTFRLLRDRPGRSYALEIAHRLGFPEPLLAEARSRLSAVTRDVDHLLAELESREAELEQLAAEAHSLTRELERRETGIAEREQELDARETSIERKEKEAERTALERTERYLFEARKEVERAIDLLKAEVDAGEPCHEASERREGAFSAARAAVEHMLRETKDRAPAPPTPGESDRELTVGDQVEAISLGLRGRLRELRGSEAIVETGGVRISVRAADLHRVPHTEWPARHRASDVVLPDLAPRAEVDLRGLRVEAATAALLRAVDAAVAGDLPSLRIIHGKGSGALRQLVRELLGSDPRVPRFRPGAFEEGGSGVTVVQFAKSRD